MTTYKEAMREAYAAGWRAHVGGARDNQDAHFEAFFAEHLKRVAPPPEEIKPGMVFPMRVTNFQTQAEAAARVDYADVERKIHASFAIPEAIARGKIGVTGVRTGRFSASNSPETQPPKGGAWLDEAGSIPREAFPVAPTEIGGKLANGPTDEELKAWYDNGRDLQRDVVVVATTDKDQDGNVIEREISREEYGAALSKDWKDYDNRDVSDAQEHEALIDEAMKNDD